MRAQLSYFYNHIYFNTHIFLNHVSARAKWIANILQKVPLPNQQSEFILASLRLFGSHLLSKKALMTDPA